MLVEVFIVFIVQPPPGDDFYDPGFTQEEMNNPNPNHPQPPFISHNQPSSPGTRKTKN